MFGLGMSEIIFLGVLALIVIGPKELPELARTLGRFLNELKRSTNVLGDELKQQAGFDKLDKLEIFENRNPHTPDPVQHHGEVAEEQIESTPDQLELTDQTSGDKSKPDGHNHS
ncbi:twin-arginine translocase TatA/TatE family subunit [Bdellovibrio sp. HCB2-146]|uniref:Sec-independent protein translocase subunit TatA/TatB n=1 Tax=Bdellovibrio sp. HCB2-146 TaxID=3394362 RepID=UPI0039BD6AF0